jgi:hypothetical protein
VRTEAFGGHIQGRIRGGVNDPIYAAFSATAAYPLAKPAARQPASSHQILDAANFNVSLNDCGQRIDDLEHSKALNSRRQIAVSIYPADAVCRAAQCAPLPLIDRDSDGKPGHHFRIILKMVAFFASERRIDGRPMPLS